ncbi:RNA polymerase sigma-70 factor (ECF subfamily) [Filimonas zeae]|uniref:RNA polymerase sigma-70 factor, ECF subfamily n=1 Tax=Filimonas zeae TaxID=1737353 RepID=A0A917IN80_9BACT|nr:sigma-70 family RNA polymerase sigma factor [Filimonas zeae]MDR6337594.1 RNA polymerase sigma-70 factor (ECF subfamily) [Filimonas zeae]GGH59368.1 hypothetical protein GCM10011379_06060 [Filimonas zeae]
MSASVINITAYQQLHKGDEAGFKALYTACWYELYETAYAKTGDKAQAQDMVQELFIAVWKNGIPAREGASVKEYLYGALRNRVFNYYRSAAVQEKYKTALEASWQLLADVTLPGILEADELERLVEKEVQQMPTAMQMVYRMSREEGLSALAIAEALQLSPQTVRNQISAALARIRSMLIRESFISLLGACYSCYQIVMA